MTWQWRIDNRWCGRLVGLCLLAAVLLPGPAVADDARKRLLVLHSYHSGYKWTDDITHGIEQVLAAARYPISVQYESMDTKKLFDEVYRGQLVELYRYKFRSQAFDAIITSDDNAFDFMLREGALLFPEVPVVFCGVNYLDPARLRDRPHITGINEAADLAGNLDLILQLHPLAQQIAVVVDRTETGERMRARLAELAPLYRERVELVELSDLSMAELEAALRQLPPQTVVFYTLFIRDRLQQFYEYDDSIRRVVQASPVPVYVTWDFSLGFGAAGGLLTSGLAQGEAAARMALRILQGESPASVPVVMQSPNRYMFDYPVMQRFDILPSRLPAAAQVLNAPDEHQLKYQYLIWRSLAGVALLLGAILVLTTNILRRRRAEAALTLTMEGLEEKVRLRTQDLTLANQRLNWDAAERDRLLQELSMMKRAVDHSSCSVIILNPDFRVEYVNPRFSEITGFAATEVLGCSLAVLRGETWHTDFAGKERAPRDGREWQREFSNRRKDGSLYFESAAISPIFDETGRLTHYVSINEDITDRKQAEESLAKALAEAVELSKEMELANAQVQEKNWELQQANRQLQAAQEQMLQQEKMASIGQLAAGVAHEINNPMGFVASNLGTLRKYLDRLGGQLAAVTAAAEGHAPPAVADELRQRAKQEKIGYILQDGADLIEESLEGAERVKTIVQGLKTFARTDQAERKTVDLHECLDSTISIVWNEIKYKAELVKDYGALPPVDCYPQQLGQVFMNILVNAAQAMAERGTIAVRTRQEDGQLRVAISDTGCGIKPENLGRIFDPFFTTKEVGKGTGLGMSIAYDIVKKHGGDIRVESAVGQGTTFTVSLPVTEGP